MSDPARTLESMLTALQGLPQRLAAALASLAHAAASPPPPASAAQAPAAPRPPAAAPQAFRPNPPGDGPDIDRKDYNRLFGVDFSIGSPPEEGHDVYGAGQNFLNAASPFLPGPLGRAAGLAGDWMGKTRHLFNTWGNLKRHWGRATDRRPPYLPPPPVPPPAPPLRPSPVAPRTRLPRPVPRKTKVQPPAPGKLPVPNLGAGRTSLAGGGPRKTALAGGGPRKTKVQPPASGKLPVPNLGAGRTSLAGGGPRKTALAGGGGKAMLPVGGPPAAESQATSGRDRHLEDNTEATAKLTAAIDGLKDSVDSLRESHGRSGGGGGKSTGLRVPGQGEAPAAAAAGKQTKDNLDASQVVEVAKIAAAVV